MASSYSKIKWIYQLKSAVSNLHIFIWVYMLIILTIYLLCIFIPEKISSFKFNLPTVCYILLSLTAIVMTTWGNKIGTTITSLFSHTKNTDEEKSIDQKRIRFLLILIYFMAIVIFTMTSLMNIPIFNIDKMDYSIIQSFATYIAYDRIVRNYASIAEKPKPR